MLVISLIWSHTRDTGTLQKSQVTDALQLAERPLIKHISNAADCAATFRITRVTRIDPLTDTRGSETTDLTPDLMNSKIRLYLGSKLCSKTKKNCNFFPIHFSSVMVWIFSTSKIFEAIYMIIYFQRLTKLTISMYT